MQTKHVIPNHLFTTFYVPIYGVIHLPIIVDEALDVIYTVSGLQGRVHYDARAGPCPPGVAREATCAVPQCMHRDDLQFCWLSRSDYGGSWWSGPRARLVFWWRDGTVECRTNEAGRCGI